MSAPMNICVLCVNIISDRGYRSLSSITSQEQYREVFKLMCIPVVEGNACRSCAHKLNRIVKLNNDLKTILIKIRHERDQLVSTLKNLSGVRLIMIQEALKQKGIKREFSEVDSSSNMEPASAIHVIHTKTVGAVLSGAIIHAQNSEPSGPSAKVHTQTTKSSTFVPIAPRPTPTSSAMNNTPTLRLSSSNENAQEVSASKTMVHSPTLESAVSSAAMILTESQELSGSSAIIYTQASEPLVSSIKTDTETSESSTNNDTQTSELSKFPAIAPRPAPMVPPQLPIPQLSAIIYKPTPPYSVMGHNPTQGSLTFSANNPSPPVQAIVKKEPCDWLDTSKPVWPSKCHGVDKFTQTEDHSEEFHVKVIVKYNGVERLRIIKQKHEQAALKSLLNSSSPRAVLRNLCQHEPYRWEVLEMVRNAIQDEIKQITKEDCHLYKGQASRCDHSCEFDWQHTQNELQLKAPYLYSVFSSAICLHEKKNLKQMLTAVAVFLYGRSQIMNQLQYALGLILHKYGLSKRGMNVIHEYGITVSSSSLLRKRKEIVKKQGRPLGLIGACCVEDDEGDLWEVKESPPEDQLDTTTV